MAYGETEKHIILSFPSKGGGGFLACSVSWQMALESVEL